jgi:hypothetical protein
MADQKEKPAHVQVAEAGFGAAVEAKGFRKVGRTHWRLDGDGIIWRVAITPGSILVDGSFEIFQGVYVEGLDALYEKIGGKKKSERLGKTSTPAHSWSDLVNDIVSGKADELERVYQEEVAEWRREMGFWKFLPLEPEKPDYRKQAWDIPYIQREGKVGDRYFFTLNAAPADEVIAFATEQWVRWMYEDVETYPDRKSVCKGAWGQATVSSDFGLAIAFVAAKLVGDQEQIQAMADAKFKRAQQPISFFRRENREDWTYWFDTAEWCRRRRDGFYNRTRKEHAIVSKREAIRDCGWMLEWSKKLHLGIDDPGIDWNFLKKYEKI